MAWWSSWSWWQRQGPEFAGPVSFSTLGRAGVASGYCLLPSDLVLRRRPDAVGLRPCSGGLDGLHPVDVANARPHVGAGVAPGEWRRQDPGQRHGLPDQIRISGQHHHTRPVLDRAAPCVPRDKVGDQHLAPAGQDGGDALRPDYIYIATEGPLGMAARRYCLRRRLHFTTSFTTNFPKYGRLRLRGPEEWTFAWLRWFHAPADNVLVAAPSLREELAQRGFRNLRA